MGPTKSKTIYLKGVGDVLMERSERAKYVNLSIKPFKGVRIAVPKGVSFKEAEAVAKSKTQWLKDHLDRMASIEEQILSQRQTSVINVRMARRFLVERLDTLARQHGFSYNRVFIRNQRTRWGSCSGKNNINLNINLVQLPRELIDYTILHELVHTRVRNHSDQFWAELAKYIPDPKQVDRQLNQYWMLLMDVES